VNPIEPYLSKTIYNSNYGGSLCRGALPERQWMNVPEAFFMCIKNTPEIIYKLFKINKL
jgi:hypothetical protein